MKHIGLIILSVFYVCNSSAQSFLNGSFETTTSTGCNYNMTNATYNTLMSSSNSFGSYQAIDIVVSGCYIPSVPNGITAVSIANNPTNNALGEAISLTLSAPLVMGNSYTISFQALALTSFGPQGNLMIGASTSNSTFGTTLYTATTVNTGWTTFTFTFVAPNNSSHITVMPVPGVSSWNSIDNFLFISTLPTELIDFSANLTTNNDVLLEWSTASERNNDAFTIERSLNGQEWESIHSIDGAGNSSQILKYRATDHTPYLGKSYYRLKQIDFDGQSSYSSIKIIENNTFENSQIKIYPNPSSGLITLEGEKSILEPFKVYNLIGEDVSDFITYNNSIASKLVIDFSNLVDGVYYIRTKTSTYIVHKQ